MQNNKPNIQPVNQRVLIQLIEPADSVLELPEDSINPEGYVVVVAVAADCKTGVASGDNIIFLPGANVLGLKHDGLEKFAMIHESSIVAIDRREKLNIVE